MLVSGSAVPVKAVVAPAGPTAQIDVKEGGTFIFLLHSYINGYYLYMRSNCCNRQLAL